MSEMCYFLHDDIDMGAHIYTCGHQKEMTWGKCPCKAWKGQQRAYDIHKRCC